MALILSIDSGRRQNGPLESLVRGRLGAELVQATSATEGIDALRGRIPDLILTPPFLSPRDEGLIAAHLRELGRRAFHVQTLTTPVLRTSPETEPVPQAKGMLASLRRTRSRPVEQEGCDPEVFADQVNQYLTTAEEQRRALGVSTQEARLDAVEEPNDPVPEMALAVDPVDAPEADPGSGDVSVAILERLMDSSPPLEPSLPLAPSVLNAASSSDLEAVASAAEEPAAVPPIDDLPLATEALPEVALLEAALPEAPAESTREPGVRSSFGDLYASTPADEAWAALTRQPLHALSRPAIPGEAPIPVVEMVGYGDLDAIAQGFAAPDAEFVAPRAAPLVANHDAFVDLPEDVPEDLSQHAAERDVEPPVDEPPIDEPVTCAPLVTLIAEPDEPAWARASIASHDGDERWVITPVDKPTSDFGQPLDAAPDVAIEAATHAAVPIVVVPIDAVAIDAAPIEATPIIVATNEVVDEAPSAPRADSDVPLEVIVDFIEGMNESFVSAHATDTHYAPLAPFTAAAPAVLDDEALSMIGDAAFKLLDTPMLRDFWLGLNGDPDVPDRPDVSHAPEPTEDIPEPVSTAPPAAQVESESAAEDEWGLFDPAKAGFGALVERMDEADHTPTSKKKGTKARVVSY
jgi:hypothetical protein